MKRSVTTYCPHCGYSNNYVYDKSIKKYVCSCGFELTIIPCHLCNASGIRVIDGLDIPSIQPVYINEKYFSLGKIKEALSEVLSSNRISEKRSIRIWEEIKTYLGVI